LREPDHRPAPAFERAGEAEEAKRQQQVAALSEQQQAGYERLLADQKQMRDRQREKQQAQERALVAERMRRHMLQDRQRHLKPPSERHKLKRPNDLSRAIDDHLAGRETAVTKEYHRQLNAAAARARVEVAKMHKQAREKLAAAQKRQRDVVLSKAARQRAQGTAAKEFNFEAARPPRLAPQFENAARDQALGRAFEKAVKAEAGRGPENEHDIGRDIGEGR